MKFVIILVFICFSNLSAQLASTFFPGALGHKWYFKTTPLDSLNNKIDSLSFFEADSFAAAVIFKGKNAKLVLSKTGTQNTLNALPYTDSNYVNLDGNNGSVYFRTTDIDTTLGTFGAILNLFKSFENWYSVYRFQQTVNLEYTVFQYDTTVTVNSITLPLRFAIRVKRLADQTLATQIGSFSCKKFIQAFSVSYLVQLLPPPFPPAAIPIATVNDSVWIAPGKWIVQSITPSTSINLEILNLGSFWLLGSQKIIVPTVVADIKNEEASPNTFSMKQNYPNPFNPSTTINFSIPITHSGIVTLKVYDILGNLVDVILNEVKSPGEYSVSFTPSKGLPSGLYFYTLFSNGKTQTRKMLFLK